MIIQIAVIGAALVSSARAAERPHQLSISVVVPTDVLKFERIASARYHVRFRRIIAADIDRDGDLDVVAATEHDFMVWMNDGFGHLNRQIPRRSPFAAGRSAERTWGSDGTR